MRTNFTLDKLRKGEVVLGCALQSYRSAEIPRVYGAAGFDYVFIDAEHSGFDLETVQDMIATSVQAGITPLVRVGEFLYSLVARFLDVGAQGIILPRAECSDVLDAAIHWTKFPPAGRRGFGVMAPQLDYEQRDFAEIIDHLNRNTMVVVQFETATAMERADELLAVNGIDVAMVGPSDLSISLGVPGQFDHPLLVDSVCRFMEICRRHNVIPGIHCRNPSQAGTWIERGMRFVGAGGEQGLLLEKSRQTVADLRAAVERSATEFAHL